MIPATFDYEVAESAEHAVELLGSREDAKLLAGGHSLIPLLKLRFTRPSLLVDIGRIDELSYVRDTGEWLAIGALTRHKAIRDDPLVQEHCPIVSHTAGLIGDPQVRHRGTIGGSLAHCDPASDLPAVMLALGSEFVITGPDGERTVDAAEFFQGVFDSAIGPQEMLTEIRVPKLGNWTGWSYLKYNRRAQDWATVGVAALVRHENGSDEGRGRPDRAHEHGRDAVARGRGGAGARRRRSRSGCVHGGRDRSSDRHCRERGVPLAPGARDRQARDRGGDG